MSPDPGHEHLLLVLGTPCGGTTYLAGALRGAGYRIGHESYQADGMVCGFAHLAEPEKIVGHTHEMTWRVIRSPLSTLETLPGFVGRSPLKGPHRSPVEQAEAALRWWLAVHESLSDLPTVRVEHYERDIPWLVSELAKVQAPIDREPDYDPGLYVHHKGRRWIPRDWDPAGPEAWSWEYARGLWPELAERAYRICETYDITANPPVRHLDTRRRVCPECGRPWVTTLRAPIAKRHCKTCLRAWAGPQGI